MRRFRFTIAQVLVVVLFVAVAFAALGEATDLWESGVLSLTIGGLLVSILLAVHRRAERRAYWLGFALLGWAYFAASHIPALEPRLLTTKVLMYLDAKAVNLAGAGMAVVDFDSDGNLDLVVTNPSNQFMLYRNNGNGVFQDVSASAGLNLQAGGPTGSSRIWRVLAGTPRTGRTSANFLRIGHSLLALFMAVVGGHMSRLLSRQNESR
jgi:hypothetical protein